MPDISATRPDERPTEGFSTAHFSAHPSRPVRMFLPADYQPKYAYPLVVVFHADGTDEDAAVRLVPQFSRRNYVSVCPRGPVRLASTPTGRPAFGWGLPRPQIDDFLLATLAHACQNYHIHSERVYLVGIGEGATAAYRFALGMAGAVAGVVALNGHLPEFAGRPRLRRKAISNLRVFVGHGLNNPVVPVAAARRDSRLLSAAGANVRFNSYPTTQRLHPDMFRDVNRWIMDAISPDTDLLPELDG